MIMNEDDFKNLPLAQQLEQLYTDTLNGIAELEEQLQDLKARYDFNKQ